MPPAEDQPLTNMWANQFLVQQSATQQQSESGLTEERGVCITDEKNPMLEQMQLWCR